MQTIVSLLLIIISLQVHAEDSCKFVLDTHMTTLKIFGEPTDVQEMVSQSGHEISCRTFYKINVGEEWRSASGLATGISREEACSRALSLGNGRLLSEIAPDKINSTTETLCTDFEEIRLRPVKIGDRIWESNVDIHSNFRERNYFNYKGARCRKFSERIQVPQGLYSAQGVICRTGSTPNARWLVIDKF